MNGAVAVGPDALGERFVSIVTKLLRGPASRVGEVPLPVGSTLRPWMAAAPGAAEATEGWLASVRFPSFESVFAGGAGGEGDVEGEGAGKGARHATAPKVRGGRGGRGPGGATTTSAGHVHGADDRLQQSDRI